MSTENSAAADLASVVEHEAFPDVDLALRRGRHIDREDADWYAFLTEAQPQLERFYRRYGAELIQRSDGFFFLLPSGDKLGRRHLSPAEMLIGQGLTLLYLDPATVQQGGVTTREQLLAQLSAVMGVPQLMQAFNAKKRRMDERVAQEMVRAKVSEGVRRLASLGFVQLLPEDRMRLRASLLRFAEPVRGSGAEAEALARLVAAGEVTLTAEDVDTDGSDVDTDGSDVDTDGTDAEDGADVEGYGTDVDNADTEDSADVEPYGSDVEGGNDADGAADILWDSFEPDAGDSPASEP
jgi:chromosome partition protein MukE